MIEYMEEKVIETEEDIEVVEAELITKSPIELVSIRPQDMVVPRSYEQLAKKLGVCVAGQAAGTSVKINNDFMQFLSDHGLVLYDRVSVSKFLKQKAGKRNVVWRPLREADKAKSKSRWEDRPVSQYKKAVPYPVLLLVQDILEKFPMAKFYVSDYQVVRPDPFLEVRLNGKRYVVEHWDEPEFGIKASTKGK